MSFSLSMRTVFFFFFVFVITAESRANFIKVDPRQTFYNGTGLAAVPLELSSLGISAGNSITLEVVGDYSFTTSGAEIGENLLAVFSGSSTLLSTGQINRVPDAIAVPGLSTGAVGGNGIDQDFAVIAGTSLTLVVPNQAQFLFLAAVDSGWNDNRDRDNDYGVNITNLSASAVPEPSSLVLLSSGLLALLVVATRTNVLRATTVRRSPCA